MRQAPEEHMMMESSAMRFSRLKGKKNASKMSKYETNMENYMMNEQFSLQKVDPQGIIADAIYVSFSGVIECAELFFRENQDFQISYELVMGQEWRDEKPEKKGTEGKSTFCESKNGKVTFSLNFDCLLSCVYIQSWPQLLITLKGFNFYGDLITKGYAQIHLPVSTGPKVKQAYIYSIVKDIQWYHKIFPFLAPNPITLQEKDFLRIVAKGEGRQVEKVKSVGRLKVRSQILMRNYSKFGYC